MHSKEDKQRPYKIYAPFRVILPESTQLDQDSRTLKLLQIVEAREMTLVQVDQIARNPLDRKHPTIDLEALEEKRNKHLIPSPEDATILQNVVQECEEDIEALHAKIASTMTSIADLCRELSQTTAQLAQKCAHRDVCRTILSSVQRVPDDVLELIFLASLDPPHPPDTRRAPLQLTTVCRRWRTIACSMQTLWSTLYISEDRPFSLDLAKLWISRSSRLSLILRVHRDNPTHSQVGELIAYLRASSVQLDALDLCAGLDSKRQLLSLLEFARAEEVVLPLYWPGSSDLTLPQTVKRLYLYYTPRSWFTTPPSRTLTVLYISYAMHWEMLHFVIRHCQDLQHLCVSVASWGNRPHYYQDNRYGVSSTNPTLVYLGLINEGTDADVDILGGLSFPSLRVLEYSAHMEEIPDIPTWLMSHTVLHTIRRLTLQYQSHLSEETLYSLLRPAAMLEELCLSCGDIETHQTALQVLSNIPSSDSDTLRRLKRLNIFCQLSTSELPLIKSQVEHLAQRWAHFPVHTNMHVLTHFNLIHWHNEEAIAVSTPWIQLRDAIQGVSPDLIVQISRYSSLGVLSQFPMGFELVRPPWSDWREFEVLTREDTWVTKPRPIYHVS
ncbi:hypothetical protein BDN72DRAFT_900517 [Pluteus cervinus]|uniref:Uncharacterized protein n=1 Tax=Pluteus cervinus TaxID=181527 RepID=A0ACD3AJZ4_9AGAR|nr:hypothetical protein BDN72DRAFT_900517 [Pluteus cervinus]